jgi:hypothetical protein
MASNIVIDIAAEFTGKKAFNQTEKAIDKLGSKLKGALIGGSILALTSRAIKAFAEEEKSASLLANTLGNLGYGMATKSVEEFISKLQLATGVSDSELRPAMAKLVQTLGSVSLAQDALTLAMDVSASSGIGLDTVVSDLAAAQNGNLAGLKKYNLGLTALQLKTMSTTEVMDRFNKVFGGGAAVAADTFAGKLSRINVAIDEAKESLGKGIIDALMVATGSADIEILQQKIINFGKQAGEAIANLGKVVNNLLPIIKTVGAAFLAIWTVTSYLGAISKFKNIIKEITKVMKALRIVAISTAIAQAFVLNPIGGIAVAAGIIAVLGAVGYAVDNLDAKYGTLGKKQKDFFEEAGGLKFGEQFDFKKYKDAQAAAKEQADADKKAADDLRKAEEKAAKARAKQAALELAAKQKADKLAAAAKQKSDRLAKASAMFDLDKIQLAAALKGKITADEKLRLELQQAILNENDELADKLQKKLEASQIATAKLTAQIVGIKPAVNPFDSWLTTLSDIATKLGMIAGVNFNPTQNKDRNIDDLAAAAAAAKAAAAAAAAKAAAGAGLIAGGGAGGNDTKQIAEKLGEVIGETIVKDPYISMPSEPSYSSGAYGNTGGFGFSLPSYLQNTIPQVTVNVEAGTLVMQDELVTIINDAVVAAQKNGYTQMPNGAIL